MSRMPNQKIIWLLFSVKNEIEAKYKDYLKRYNATKSAIEENELIKKANVLVSENDKIKAYLDKYRKLYLALNVPGNSDTSKILIAINLLEIEIIEKYLTKELESELKIRRDMRVDLSIEQSRLKREIAADAVGACLSLCLVGLLSGLVPSVPEIGQKVLCAIGSAVSMYSCLASTRDWSRNTDVKKSNEETISSIGILESGGHLDELGVKPHF